MAVEAIIFDFDGVIIDTESSRATKIKELLALHNIEINRNHFKAFAGRTTQSIIEAEFVDQLRPDQMEDILERYTVEFKSNITNFMNPIKPTIEYIKQSTGKKLAIASMSSTMTLRRVLEKLEIDNKFSVISGKEVVTHQKPHPEIYLKTAEALGVSPSHCVAVEDTVIGASAAIAAGMPCYILLNGRNSRDEFEGVNVAGFIATLEDYKHYFEGDL